MAIAYDLKQPVQNKSPVERNKLRLMVVDDEADNLDLLHRTFRRDFQVFRADSALDALNLLEQVGEMGIIISDQRMPKMNGTEFLSHVARQFPDTIRILLTGYTDVEDLVNAINAGKVFKYITKPWNPEDLMTVVQQAADTYRVVKQRTNELHRALRRESIFNKVSTATRESLDYQSMMQRIAEVLGQTFGATCVLHPVERDSDGVLTGDGNAYRLLPDLFSFSSNSSEEISPLLLPNDALLAALQSRRVQLSESDKQETRLALPLIYQQELLAIASLHRQGQAIAWSEEDLDLIQEVAERVALAISQAKLYQRIQRQTEQMQAELAVARQIQTNLLRQSLPELDSAKIQACCHPAREVGGDFFEVYEHPQGDLWLGVGDVSGKGVPAALFMASAISVLRREIYQENPPDPAQVMQNLNSSLMDDLVSNNCFITMALARYSPATQELVYANAGHIYPMVWSVDKPSAEPIYLKERGVPLGILPVWRAIAGRLRLQPGDLLLLISDGITEATLAHPHAAGNSPMLGQQGLWELLKRQPQPLDLSKLLSCIQSQSHAQEDDQTILSLEVL
ncbi:Hydrogenase transcriptional regulatory protein hupR1 [Leptolyngbya sp. O-77]|nr:Hydrogenase transcriptional regulatory protein hupR1 [Leptolyngbya sp. O-77]